QEVTPFCEGSHDGQKFTVVDFVVTLGRVERPRQKCDGMPDFILTLGENGSHSVTRTISFNTKGIVVGGNGKDRGGRHTRFEILERLFLSWFRNVTKSANEATIKINKTEERLEFLFGGGGRPVENTLNLDRVHADLVLRDDQAQVLDFGSFEFTFLRFEVEFVLTENVKYTLGNTTVFFECTCED
ncbi:hypothetical protein PAXINDRAFT_91808, partial [Paxillus involutus ATCC 200175]